METSFKILQFKNNTAVNTGLYPVIINIEGKNEIGGCGIPQLMKASVTFKNLKFLYPYLDFEKVELILVKLHTI